MPSLPIFWRIRLSGLNSPFRSIHPITLPVCGVPLKCGQLSRRPYFFPRLFEIIQVLHQGDALNLPLLILSGKHHRDGPQTTVRALLREASHKFH